jgi:trimeric autotransporter adhesin
MPHQKVRLILRQFAVVWLATDLAAASEYHGAVTVHGLPLPGVTITAIQGEKKIVTTSDQTGAFSFANLPDGTWNIEVEMIGFEKSAKEVAVAANAPSPRFELKYASEAELARRLDGAPATATSVVPAPVNAAGPVQQPRNPAPAGRAPQGVRGANGGFQRLSVSQSADSATLSSETAIRPEEAADLNQSSANSFIVQGSMSSALGLGQTNDWGPGGRGMGPMGGLGMPGMGPGGNGEPISPDQAAAMGGGRGPGGPGMGGPGGGRGGPGGAAFGGPGGGPGGPPGMGGGAGGPGGGPGGPGMGGPDGPGGRGGFGGPGGRSGPDWMGRPGALAFGNGRRNPATMYNASANFSLDNSVWDARTFSVTGAAIDKPAYANGRGGFTFGGPLRIPKLVSASKRIMFTFDFNMSRNRTGTNSQPVNVPTSLERSGDFSQTTVQGTAVTIYDPLTGAPFPGNRIPANRINAAAAALLSYYPTANLASASQNYQTSWTGHSNSRNLNSRLSNIRFGSKDRLNFNIGYQDQDSSTPNLFQFLDTSSGRGLNTGLAWSHNFTTRIVNNLQYSFSRQRQQQSPYFADQQNVAAALGILGTSQNPMNWGPPSLNFTNYAGLSDGNASLNRNQASGIGDSLSWVRGRHNLTFGGDYRRQQFNQFADSNGRGTFTFNGLSTSLLVNGVAQSGTGYDLADFLLGLPTTSSIRYGNPDKYFRGSGYDAYLNDDLRLRPNLSLILGLRWEYGTPVTELYNRLVNLDIGPAYSAIAAVLPGQTAPWSGDLGNALIRPDRNNFSPRLGLAWRPRNGKSMVVRAGYGLYYNTSVYNGIAANMAQQAPFAQTVNVSTSAANVLTLQNGFLASSTSGLTNTYAIDPNYRVGYAQTWNVTLQSDLKFGLFGTIGYLGTKGTRLDQQFIPNSVAPGAAESIYPHGFIYETSNGNSTYHAAQFQLNRRMRSGLMANASYQFSKSIDNAGTGGRGQGGTPVAQNWQDLSAERGLSSFDARHNLNIAFMYSTGMGMSGGSLLNGWKGKLFKDWNLMSNINVHSGNPLTATVGGNLSQVGGTAVNSTVRADATGLPVEASGLLFNTAAFTSAAAGLWGTAGRNTIPGPTVFTLNGSVGRVFRFGERHSVDLQLQAQNVLNKVTITNWSTVVGANNYGLATAASGMRKITAMLRFRF